MDLNKSLEFFDPNKVKKRCHIIGCGSIGSNVAELLVRYGITNITLYDFDIVESHNLANQLYDTEDINKPKVEALAEKLIKINPDIKSTLKIENEGYIKQTLNGYVFMCVDSMVIRNKIVSDIRYNPYVLAVYDFRTTLLEGQCYYADWSDAREKESLITSMDFTDEEARENTPVSACGFELSVSPVVKMTALMGVANFTNLINEAKTKRLILVQPYSYFFEAA